MIAQHKRQLKSGKQYDHLIPNANFQNTKLSDLIEVGFTVKSMQNIVRATHTDVARLAQVLKGNTITQTCSNIFDFVYHHIQYVKDKTGIEEIRTPARIWADRKGDCDCYSTFIGAILYSLKIPFAFRITKYAADWQHVYIIVYNENAPNRKELKTFLNEETGEEYEKVVRTNKPKGYNIIDPVVDDDDYEVEFTDKQDHKMSTFILSGIDDHDDNYGLDYEDDDYGTTTVEEDLGALGLFKRRRRKKRKRRKKKKRGGLFSKKRRKARKEKRKTKRASKRANKAAKKRLSKNSLNDLITAYKKNRSVLNDRTWQALFKQFLARAKRDASYKSELSRISKGLHTRGFWNSILRNSTFKKAYNDYNKNPSSSAKKGRRRGLFSRRKRGAKKKKRGGLFSRFRKKKGTKKKKRGGLFSRFRKNKGTKKRGGIFSKFRKKLKDRKKKRKDRRKKIRVDKKKNGRGGFLSRLRDKRRKRRELRRSKKNGKDLIIRTNPNIKITPTKDSINPVKDTDTGFDDFDTGADSFDDFDAGTSNSTTTTTNTKKGKDWFEDGGDTWNSEGDWGSDDTTTTTTTTQKGGGSAKTQKQEDPFFDTSTIDEGIDVDLDFDMNEASSEVEHAAKEMTKNLPVLQEDFTAMLKDDAGGELLDEEGDFADAKFDEVDEFGDDEPKELNIFQKGVEWAKENPKTAAGVAIGATVIIGGTAYLLTRPKKPISYKPYRAKSTTKTRQKKNYKPRSAGKKKTVNGIASFAGFQ